MTRRRLRFTIVVTLLVAAILAVALILVVNVSVRNGMAMTRQRILSSSEVTLSVVSKTLFDPLYSLDLSAVETILNGLPGADASIAYAAVRDADGQSQAKVTGAWSPSEQDSLELAAEALRTGEIQSREIGEYLFLSGPIAVESERIGTLEMAFDQTQFLAALGTVQRTIIVLTILIINGAIVAVFLVARRVAAPLRELTAAADEIGRGNLNVAIPIHGAQEMAALGVALERMRADLLALYRDLEQQVASLERRARYQDATATVARDVASVLNVEELLARLVMLISKQLGFYHTGLFLLDETGEYAELRAASSEGGQRMLAREHRLRVGEESIVGYVAHHGVHRVALDVGEDAVYFENPDLPGTHSEIALPLRARGEILGVLDVQSEEPEAFTAEDVSVLQTLADQVAMAISNAQLFGQVQEALEAERRAYGELSRRAWADLLQARSIVGYHYGSEQGRVTQLIGDGQRPEPAEELPEVELPIRVHGAVIGTINAHKPADAGAWTSDEVSMLEELAGQLGIAMESARLYQDTQRRAARERLVGGIADHLQRAPDMEMLLQIAAQELNRALRGSRAYVHLGMGALEDEPNDGNEPGSA